MNPMLPPSAEAAGVFALLEVISDPKKAKAALDEIAGKQAELKQTLDTMRIAQADLKAFKVELDNRSADLDRRDGMVRQREAQVAHDAQSVRQQGEAWRATEAARLAAEHVLEEKQKQVLIHENGLVARENALQRLEVETKNRAARLSEEEARLNDRLTKLRALAG